MFSCCKAENVFKKSQDVPWHVFNEVLIEFLALMLHVELRCQLLVQLNISLETDVKSCLFDLLNDGLCIV